MKIRREGNGVGWEWRGGGPSAGGLPVTDEVCGTDWLCLCATDRLCLRGADRLCHSHGCSQLKI